MTLLVRDEADIVAQNIEHHLNAGVDFVVATDNGSTDGTLDILDAYERAGVLKLVREPEQNFAQVAWMTRMAHQAREDFGADWVLNNDADEFWHPLAGDLKSGLRPHDGGVMRCPRCTLIYAFDTDTSVPWPDRVVFRTASPQPRPSADAGPQDPHYYYLAAPKALASTAGLTRVHMGNHDVDHETPLSRLKPTIRVYHVPIRDEEQYRRRVVQGAAALEANRNFGPGVGWHWRQWNQVISEAASIDAVMQRILPDRERLERDLAAGVLVKDTTVRDSLRALGAVQSTSA